MKKYPIDNIVRPIYLFMRQEKSAGIVLAICVIVAMALANSPLSTHYFEFLEQHFGFQVNGQTYLEFSVLHWINDGLMAMFFFVVGLGLKREFIGGELSNPRKAMLPIAAAVGGMVVPALIYFSLNPFGEPSNGWGIPMATDIVFAIGVLYLLGNRVPMALKVFILALAIVDDLGAVLVVAFFYTEDISLVSLLLGLSGFLVMLAANRLGVKNVVFYAIIGIGGVWLAFLLSGVHATIAAVLAAFAIPSDVRISEKAYSNKVRQLLRRFDAIDPRDENPVLTEEQVLILERINDKTIDAMPPLQRLEARMNPFVSFVVMPIFVLANAGVSFGGMNFGDLFSTNIFWGVSLGLFLGKVVGIFGFSWLMIRFGAAQPFEGMSWRNLFGLGLVASIGFTMSLFITSLAFTDALFMTQAKLGIFVASIVGGTFGYLVLKRNK